MRLGMNVARAGLGLNDARYRREHAARARLQYDERTSTYAYMHCAGRRLGVMLAAHLFIIPALDVRSSITAYAIQPCVARVVAPASRRPAVDLGFRMRTARQGRVLPHPARPRRGRVRPLDRGS